MIYLIEPPAGENLLNSGGCIVAGPFAERYSPKIVMKDDCGAGHNGGTKVLQHRQ